MTLPDGPKEEKIERNLKWLITFMSLVSSSSFEGPWKSHLVSGASDRSIMRNHNGEKKKRQEIDSSIVVSHVKIDQAPETLDYKNSLSAGITDRRRPKETSKRNSFRSTIGQVIPADSEFL